MAVVHTHFFVHTVVLTWGMWFGTETGYQMRICSLVPRLSGTRSGGAWERGYRIRR